MMWLRFFLIWIVTLMLSIVPMPEILNGLRPSWVGLFFLYIQLFLPHYFSMILLFVVGVSMDVLLATPIGVHTLALLLMSWSAIEKVRRFKFFSMIQQMVWIVFFLLIYQFTLFGIDWILGYRANPLFVLGNVLFNMLLWPWIRVLMDHVFTIKKKDVSRIGI